MSAAIRAQRWYRSHRESPLAFVRFGGEHLTHEGSEIVECLCAVSELPGHCPADMKILGIEALRIS